MKYYYLYFLLFSLISCGSDKTINLLLQENFQTSIDGASVSLYTITDDQGLVAQITNYGAKIAALYVPDAAGEQVDIVAGFDNIDQYLVKERTFGAVMGRYGGRIAYGQFALDGQCYQLHKNKIGHHMHGGRRGFSNVVWSVVSQSSSHVELTYTSAHMEEGYPGNLKVNVRYLLHDSELKMAFYAMTDQATVINLINHSYFNLKGVGNGDALDHRLLIAADYYTEEDANQIPTGRLISVEGTVLDFTKMRRIGDRVSELPKGVYDHNYVLNNSEDNLNFAARLEEPVSGRIMEVYTNQPGMQFYVRNFKGDGVYGKHDKLYKGKSALCFETQHFPNSPNTPEFPSTVLRPGDEFEAITCFRFFN